MVWRSMSIPRSGKEFLVYFADEFDSKPGIWLTLFGVFYLGLVLPGAFRPFWYDELFTYNVATLPGFRAMWDALTRGADLNPPLFYVVTHAAISVFGNTEFALRTPAIAGFGVMCCCLYAFVAHRAGACYGFIAMLLPLVTGAMRWAPEARAYGLLLGFCGLALVSWQRAAEASPRMVPLAGLAISLTAALLTHCFAVLVLAPFALAQLVRDYTRRKIDWPMWMCIVFPLTACITYLPLLATSRRFALQYRVFEPGWRSVVEFSDTVFAPALWPVLAGMVIIAFGASQRPKVDPPHAPLWKTGEVVVAAGFLLVPLLAIALSKITLGIFMVRYGISAVIAVAILFAQAAATLTGRSKMVGSAVVLVIAGFAAGTMAVTISKALAPPEEVLHLDQHAELPLVVSSGLIFYPLSHYATASQANRMWFLTDEKIALRVTGSNMFEKGLPVLNRIFPLRGHLGDYSEFLAAHPRFLLYGYADNKMDWLIPQLRQDGAQLRYLGKRTDQMGLAVLYDVEAPPRLPSAARASGT
jgi:Dolichyl-phosphate-mannose-protein mannosyltransferase